MKIHNFVDRCHCSLDEALHFGTTPPRPHHFFYQSRPLGRTSLSSMTKQESDRRNYLLKRDQNTTNFNRLSFKIPKANPRRKAGLTYSKGRTDRNESSGLNSQHNNYSQISSKLDPPSRQIMNQYRGMAFDKGLHSDRDLAAFLKNLNGSRLLDVIKDLSEIAKQACSSSDGNMGGSTVSDQLVLQFFQLFDFF